jgi:hypothetical protein
VPVRLAAKSVKKIAKLAELEGVDRSTVLRMLIDISLASPRVSLLMLRRVKGRTAIQRAIRVLSGLGGSSEPHNRPFSARRRSRPR